MEGYNGSGLQKRSSSAVEVLIWHPNRLKSDSFECELRAGRNPDSRNAIASEVSDDSICTLAQRSAGHICVEPRQLKLDLRALGGSRVGIICMHHDCSHIATVVSVKQLGILRIAHGRAY